MKNECMVECIVWIGKCIVWEVFSKLYTLFFFFFYLFLFYFITIYGKNIILFIYIENIECIVCIVVYSFLQLAGKILKKKIWKI